MERGLLELFHTAVALLSLMHIKGDAAVLVAIFAKGVATCRPKTIHWKVNTANLVTMKLPCLATMLLAESEAVVRSTFQQTHLFGCEINRLRKTLLCLSWNGLAELCKHIFELVFITLIFGGCGVNLQRTKFAHFL